MRETNTQKNRMRRAKCRRNQVPALQAPGRRRVQQREVSFGQAVEAAEAKKAHQFGDCNLRQEILQEDCDTL